MIKKIKKVLTKIGDSRIAILGVAFTLLACILVQRLFSLQIINGESYLNDFTMQIRKEEVLKSTRGNIYDSEGGLLAYNKLAYSVTFEDNGTYETRKERNLSLNRSMYGLIQIIESGGNSITSDFGIILDGSGDYAYTKSGTSLLRFKADVFGEPYIDDLTAEQRNMTASEMIEELSNSENFGLIDEDYTPEDLASYELPQSYTKEELVKMVGLRSAVAQNSYQKYKAVTIARDIDENTMATIMENKDKYQGVDVVEDTVRVYNDAIYFAPVVGYTGKISQEELEAFEDDDPNTPYTSSDIVGKAGLEQHFETDLQGVKGLKTMFVDNLGKVLKVDSVKDPQAGDDIHLTLNRKLQIASYKILEQYIAGIVFSMLEDTKEFDLENVATADEIRIPIYDVYYALVENNVLDMTHLKADDATDLEKQIYQSFLSKEAAVFSEIKSQLTSPVPTPYKDLREEMQAYMTYIVQEMLMQETGILSSDAIDRTDETYKAWTQGDISLQEYLTYAISKNWMDVTKIDVDSEYLDSTEIFSALADYIADYLSSDNNFSKKVYKYMIEEETLNGNEVCMLLFDQGILTMNESDYDNLATGAIGGYDFMRQKILTLEITPAQLALAPCSGSVVITDPNNGNVLACVTYPGYDSNRLANDMDSDYFMKLAQDGSSPFYNKATQEETAPGSTFKLVTATAAIDQGIVSEYDTISCTGIFEEVDPPVKCWIYSGAHGPESMVTAIRDSCNFYFNSLGYMMGTNSEGKYVDELGVQTLKKYAEMYGFDSTTGIEIGETAPRIADYDVVRASMGQSNHAFTTTQLARYAATLANSGTCYDLTLLDKITDSAGNLVVEQQPVIHNQINMSSEFWDTVHTGMNLMVQDSSVFKESKNFDLGGKTGTAQETGVPNHALFIGYAPYQNPEMAIAVRITNGYSSSNSAAVADDIINYMFGLKEESEIITGTATVKMFSGNQARQD